VIEMRREGHRYGRKMKGIEGRAKVRRLGCMADSGDMVICYNSVTRRFVDSARYNSNNYDIEATKSVFNVFQIMQREFGSSRS